MYTELMTYIVKFLLGINIGLIITVMVDIGIFRNNFILNNSNEVWFRRMLIKLVIFIYSIAITTIAILGIYPWWLLGVSLIAIIVNRIYYTHKNLPQIVLPVIIVNSMVISYMVKLCLP